MRLKVHLKTNVSHEESEDGMNRTKGHTSDIEGHFILEMTRVSQEEEEVQLRK